MYSLVAYPTKKLEAIVSKVFTAIWPEHAPMGAAQLIAETLTEELLPEVQFDWHSVQLQGKMLSQQQQLSCVWQLPPTQRQLSNASHLMLQQCVLPSEAPAPKSTDHTVLPQLKPSFFSPPSLFFSSFKEKKVA